MSIHDTADARAWAEFFTKTMAENPDLDPARDTELMHGWFANAMMAMHDSIKREQDPFDINDIDLNQLDLDLDLPDLIDTDNLLEVDTSSSAIFAPTHAQVNLDVVNEQIEITYKSGRQTQITFQDLEKVNVLIDTLEQMQDTELGRLFKTNLGMHRLGARNE